MYFLHFEVARSQRDVLWLRVVWYKHIEFSERRSYAVRLQYTLFEPNSPAQGKAVRSQNSLTGIVTRLISTQCGVRILQDFGIFYFLNPTYPAWGKRGSLEYCNGFFLGVKAARPLREQLPPFHREVKNEWSYTSSPPCVFMMCRVTTLPSNKSTI